MKGFCFEDNAALYAIQRSVRIKKNIGLPNLACRGAACNAYDEA